MHIYTQTSFDKWKPCQRYQPQTSLFGCEQKIYEKCTIEVVQGLLHPIFVFLAICRRKFWEEHYDLDYTFGMLVFW